MSTGSRRWPPRLGALPRISADDCVTNKFDNARDRRPPLSDASTRITDVVHGTGLLSSPRASGRLMSERCVQALRRRRWPPRRLNIHSRDAAVLGPWCELPSLALAQVNDEMYVIRCFAG